MTAATHVTSAEGIGKTLPVRFTRFTTSGALLTKAISLEGGTLKKVACAQPSSSAAETCEIHTLEDFAHVLDELRPTQALVYGVMNGRKKAHVVTDARRTCRPGSIARTRQFFQFAAQPGVMMFDHDGMQGKRSIDPAELHSLLVGAIPVLGEVRMLWRPSVSSCILGPGGEQLTGVVGQRLYLLCEDASLIPEAGAAISELLWAAGHGWIEVGKAGQKLKRSPVDHSVWQPERLDFAAAPVLSPPLTRDSVKWRIFGAGKERMDLRAVVALADGAKKKLADRNRTTALSGSEAECKDVRRTWVSEHAPRLAEARGIPVQDAQRILEQASASRSLLGGFELTAHDGTRVTVAELLGDRDRWHGTRFADPLDPDYRNDHRVAWANLKGGGPPIIYSHAHGGCTYRLIRELKLVAIRSGERPRIVDECLDLLRTAGEVFELGDTHALVRVERGKILPVSTAWLMDHLQRHARFEERWETPSGEPRSEFVDLDEKFAKAILAKGSERLLPSLTAVVTAPTLRADGSLLDDNGYDPASGLLLLRDDPEAVTPMPRAPSIEDGLSGLRDLFQPFHLFPFVGPVDRAVHLAALLTATIRGSLPTAPAFAYDAPAAGTGKTLLARCLGALVMGSSPPVLPPITSRDDEEIRKRLFAILREGRAVAILDNVREPIGSPALDAFLTASSFSDRILGVSQTLALPNRTLLTVTGNNLRVLGDTRRRVLRCRLDARLERPFTRAFPFCPLHWTLSRRQHLVACALTVMRSWIAAGRPRVRRDSFASFEEWNELVRQPILWLAEVAKDFPHVEIPELGDPGSGAFDFYEADDETSQLGALLNAWYAAADDKWFTLSQLLSPSGPQTPELHSCMLELAGERGTVNVRSLGSLLSRNVDRPIDGLCLRRGPDHGGRATWRVTSMNSGAQEDKEMPTVPESPERSFF